MSDWSYGPEGQDGVEKLWEDGYASYDYDLVGLFKIDGELYAATTSGCSCTSPYEEYSSKADMERIRSEEEAASFWDGHVTSYHFSDNPGGATAAKMDFMRAVRENL